MADTFKVLGQLAPGAATLTALYTVPAATSVSVSSITVCNRAATSTTFRISVSIAGAADTNAQYVYYDETVSANGTYVATIGVSLAATDVIRAYAGSTSLTFQAFGVEIT